MWPKGKPKPLEMRLRMRVPHPSTSLKLKGRPSNGRRAGFAPAGMSNHPFYQIYYSLVKSGEDISSSWLEREGKGFLNFISDVGERPFEPLPNGKRIGYSLSKRDQKLCYSAENYIWIKSSEARIMNGPKRKFIGLFPFGMTKHPLAAVYAAMVYRCCDSENIAYSEYGGRGITVCDRWLEKEGKGFLNFLEDMGTRPSYTTLIKGEVRNYSLDRKDNDRGYSPDNCRWATYEEQSLNTRTQKRVRDLLKKANIT